MSAFSPQYLLCVCYECQTKQRLFPSPMLQHVGLTAKLRTTFVVCWLGTGTTSSFTTAAVTAIEALRKTQRCRLYEQSSEAHALIPNKWKQIKKGKQSNPLCRPGQRLRFQEDEGPRFQDNRHMNVVRLWALRTGLLYAQEISLALISVTGWKDHVNENSNDNIGNRTPDLPACSSVPQPGAPPRDPIATLRSRLHSVPTWHVTEQPLYIYSYINIYI
jgi:hypothetical protein